MTHAQIIHLHSLLERDSQESYKAGAEYLISLAGAKIEIEKEQALAYLTAFLYSLLAENRYIEAALMLWGMRTFDPRPQSVSRIWQAITKYDKILCMGAGVQGKSYTAVVWAFLRWIEDPSYTSVKLVSTSAGHLKSNVLVASQSSGKNLLYRYPDSCAKPTSE